MFRKIVAHPASERLDDRAVAALASQHDDGWRILQCFFELLIYSEARLPSEIVVQNNAINFLATKQGEQLRPIPRLEGSEACRFEKTGHIVTADAIVIHDHDAKRFVTYFLHVRGHATTISGSAGTGSRVCSLERCRTTPSRIARQRARRTSNLGSATEAPSISRQTSASSMKPSILAEDAIA